MTSSSTVCTAYGLVDEQGLLDLQNSYDTRQLLAIADDLDRLIGRWKREDGLRDAVLRLHGMAHPRVDQRCSPHFVVKSRDSAGIGVGYRLRPSRGGGHAAAMDQAPGAVGGVAAARLNTRQMACVSFLAVSRHIPSPW